jgi:hypothetical protein
MNLYLNQSASSIPLTTCSQFAASTCCTAEFEYALGNITQNYFLSNEDQSYPFTRYLILSELA